MNGSITWESAERKPITDGQQPNLWLLGSAYYFMEQYPTKVGVAVL